jgi:hypothetical protein
LRDEDEKTDRHSSQASSSFFRTLQAQPGLSQCFLCKPERKEFSAAMYRAKYGKEPPPVEEESEKK